MNDRITTGFLAGLIAAIPMNIIDYISRFVLDFDNKELLLDWAAVMIYGRLAQTLPEVILAQITQIIFSGFMGILFTVILLKLTSGNYLIKGWIYGLFVWFILYALAIIFRVPFLTTHELPSVVTNIFGASLYGLTLGYALKLLGNHEKI